MKMKKTVVGLLSACIVVGASATAISANEGSGNAVEQITAKVSILADGVMGKDSMGKEQLNMEILEDNMTVDVKVGEPGPMKAPVDGVEMKKEIVEETISSEIKVLAPGTMKTDTKGKEMLTKEIVEK